MTNVRGNKPLEGQEGGLTAPTSSASGACASSPGASPSGGAGACSASDEGSLLHPSTSPERLSIRTEAPRPVLTPDLKKSLDESLLVHLPHGLKAIDWNALLGSIFGKPRRVVKINPKHKSVL